MLGGRVRWEATVGRRPARRRPVPPDQRPEGVPRRSRVHRRVRPGRRNRGRGPDQARRWSPPRARSSPSSTTRNGSAAAFATFCPTERIDVVVSDDAAAARDGRRAHRPRHRGPADRRRRSRRRRRTPRRGDASTSRLAIRRAAPGPGRPRAELRGISKRFAATQALDDVSLDARRRRGPRPRRRERRGQEHAGQDPGRGPPARQRHDPARRRADPDRRPGPGPRARHRGGPPGAAPVPGPDRRRERVHRPRAGPPARRPRLGRHAPGGARPCSRSSTSSSTSARRSAACRWPTSSSSRSPRRCRSRRASCPRRADRVALGARGRAPVHDRPATSAHAASRSCSSATGSTRCSSCATGRRSSATASTSSRPRRRDLTTADLVRHMVGRAVSLFPKVETPIGDVFLEVDGLTRAGVFRDVTLRRPARRDRRASPGSSAPAGRRSPASCSGSTSATPATVRLDGSAGQLRQPVGRDGRRASPTCPRTATRRASSSTSRSPRT